MISFSAGPGNETELEETLNLIPGLYTLCIFLQAYDSKLMSREGRVEWNIEGRDIISERRLHGFLSFMGNIPRTAETHLFNNQ